MAPNLPRLGSLAMTLAVGHCFDFGAAQIVGELTGRGHGYRREPHGPDRKALRAKRKAERQARRRNRVR